jgi:hypothetical protein
MKTKKVAICKITRKEFDDYKNVSGALTTHIKSLYNIKLDSKYKRKKIELETGKFWYDSYFYFIDKEIKEIKKCSYCDWETNDIDNLSGAYEKHLKNIHNLSLMKYLEEYPQDRDYFKKEIYTELIECKECGKLFKSITNTHIKKHNLTQLEYKIKHGTCIISPQTKEKLLINYNNFLKNAPFLKTSVIEDIVIDSIPIKFEQSNRTVLDGKEIDLLYNNIGLELNGCIYHTELFGKKDRNYHLNKTNNALKKGIKLYHIFEDETHDKPNIVINKLLHIFNIDNNKKRIHARKCEIKLTDEKLKNEFLEKTHIQGGDNSVVSLGAYFNGELISIMTFDNKRYMNKSKDHNKNIYELKRFSMKNDLIITGIASKLLKYFIVNYSPKKIITFADRRWTPSTDNLYEKLGFTLIKTLSPDYYYFNPKISRTKRFHKFGFGKANIKKRFPKVFNSKKTEWEMMQELGYDRIWDCGKFKYELNFI